MAKTWKINQEEDDGPYEDLIGVHVIADIKLPQQPLFYGEIVLTWHFHPRSFSFSIFLPNNAQCVECNCCFSNNTQTYKTNKGCERHSIFTMWSFNIKMYVYINTISDEAVQQTNLLCICIAYLWACCDAHSILTMWRTEHYGSYDDASAEGRDNKEILLQI